MYWEIKTAWFDSSLQVTVGTVKSACARSLGEPRRSLDVSAKHRRSLRSTRRRREGGRRNSEHYGRRRNDHDRQQDAENIFSVGRSWIRKCYEYRVWPLFVVYTWCPVLSIDL